MDELFPLNESQAQSEPSRAIAAPAATVRKRFVPPSCVCNGYFHNVPSLPRVQIGEAPPTAIEAVLLQSGRESSVFCQYSQRFGRPSLSGSNKASDGFVGLST